MSRRTGFTAFFVLLITAGVHAQTGAELLLKPLLSEDETAEARAEALFFDRGHADGFDFQLTSYETSGRLREQRQNLVPRVGWNVKYFDLDADHPDLPGELLDASLAAGVGIKDFHGWQAGMTFGLGYAGDRPFAEGNAWYGKATLAFGKAITSKSTLGFALDYDGNRPFMPDIPLPGIGYLHQFDPRLSYVIGAPVNSVTWKPTDQFKFELIHLLLSRFEAHIDYEPVRHWVLYASYRSAQEAFHVENLPSDRRLLFDQQRVELGLRFAPVKETTLTIATGYAFDGQFNSGFDQRSRSGVADISDEPYLRVGFETRF